MPATASAIVVAPSDPRPALRPVIAWAHGTTGVARNCAPSLLPEPFESGAFYALDRVLEQGWVLVATDYTGLGTEGGHPYLVGQPAARSVLDAVRAARRLDALRLRDQTVVWGHSQGGGVALWTGQIAPTYAPDVDVVGVAALAPAADVPRLVDTMYDSTGGSLFAAYLVTGYAGAYPDVRFDDQVRPTARTVVRQLAGRCLGEPAVLASVLAAVVTDMSAYLRDLRSGPLGARLAANVPEGPFEMPVMIAQGATDTLVLPADVDAYARRLCATGAGVDHRSYERKGHIGLVAADSPLLPELVTWTSQRRRATPRPAPAHTARSRRPPAREGATRGRVGAGCDDEPVMGADPTPPDLRPGDERTALVQRLDQYRAIASAALADLEWEAASSRLLPATDLTIAGIVKHLAWVEDRWFQGRLLGVPMPAPWDAPGADDPDGAMRLAPDDSVAGIVGLYAAACSRSRSALARCDSLDHVAAVPSFGIGPVNLRWILVHMIDETARHAGHLDLLRDCLDRG